MRASVAGAAPDRPLRRSRVEGRRGDGQERPICYRPFRLTVRPKLHSLRVMGMLLTVLALGLAFLSIGGFVHAAMTQWRQSRDRGPVAIVPILPLGVATPVVFTMALRLLGTAHPTLGLSGWAYV